MITNQNNLQISERGNKKNIRLISIDLDGTLLNDEKYISEIDVNTLQKCKKIGYHLVFNTARPLKMIPKKLYDLFNEDYWVLSNGTTILNNEKVIYDITFKIKEILPLIQWLSMLKKDFFSFESNGEIFSLHSSVNMYHSILVNLDEVLDLNINKLLIISEKRDFPHHKMTPLLNGNLRKLITERGKYIQIMPRSISKLTAIRKLCNDLNLNLRNVLSFGDDINDLEVLRKSGISVAMKNADKRIFDHVKYITKSNNESGISHFINNKILM